ncbi:hypothetical protein NQ317_011823 [Molorchus minor]|uniref:Uncharacterized protein n=1 Tax=Molorchus minor TaxID=1323400 RepID=A0ABQ9JG23_9CUCU|nr:hypothetical protein NQ317_011823 [Molorchus minor]
MEFNRDLLVLSVGVLMFSVVIVNTAVVDDSGNNAVGRGLDAKSMLTSLASNFMNRGFVSTDGSSQVVSLNLTNLLVLVLLKALIFAAGSLGAGTWKGGLRQRFRWRRENFNR